MRALLIALSLATGGVVYAAPAFEVVEAVIPDWPAGQPRSLAGKVDLRFLLLGRTLLRVRSDGTDLPMAFYRESLSAFSQWLVEQSPTDGCGFVEARVRFMFDGPAAEPVRLGDIEVKGRPAPGAVYRLDHVEVHGGRIKRSKLDQAEEIAAEESRVRDAYAAWRRSRWEALGRGDPSTSSRGSPPKVKVWIESRYPKDALLLGATGDVLLELAVDAKGQVTAVELVDEPEPRVFGGSAKAAARKWQFEPARDGDGNAVPSKACQLISYRLTSVE